MCGRLVETGRRCQVSDNLKLLSDLACSIVVAVPLFPSRRHYAHARLWAPGGVFNSVGRLQPPASFLPSSFPRLPHFLDPRSLPSTPVCVIESPDRSKQTHKKRVRCIAALRIILRLKIRRLCTFSLGKRAAILWRVALPRMPLIDSIMPPANPPKFTYYDAGCRRCLLTYL